MRVSGVKGCAQVAAESLQFGKGDRIANPRLRSFRRQSLSLWIAPECRKADDHMLRPGGNIVWQRGRKTHANKTIVAFVVQRRDVSGYRQFQFRPGRTIADSRQRREAVMG
jgi:hypothetical protein